MGVKRFQNAYFDSARQNEIGLDQENGRYK